MNRERIEKLRDFLRDDVQDRRFGMEHFIWRLSDREDCDGPARQVLKTANANCGTAACVAGWGALLFLPDSEGICEFDVGIELDLTSDQSRWLFQPSGFHRPGAYTRERAVATLTRLLETGEVDWGQP